MYSDICGMLGRTERRASQEGYESGLDVAIEIARRAGEHSVADLIEKMKAEGADLDYVLGRAAKLRGRRKP
jgi:hypothetical protein